MQEHLSLAKTQNLTKVRRKWARKRGGNPRKGAIFWVPFEAVKLITCCSKIVSRSFPMPSHLWRVGY